MYYNVFGGTLNLTQSINLGVHFMQKRRLQDILRHCQSAADQSCSIHQRCNCLSSSTLVILRVSRSKK